MANSGKSTTKTQLVLAVIGSGALASIVSFSLPKIFSENERPIAVIKSLERHRPYLIGDHAVFNGGSSFDPENGEIVHRWIIETPSDDPP